MKLKSLLFFVINLTILALCVPALSLAQTNQDSSFPRILSMATEEGDPKLGTKVKLDYNARPLGEVLKNLSEESGVSLEVQASHSWAKEYHLIAITQSMPLHLALRRIASLFHLSWYVEKKSPSAPNRYVLYESAENRKYVEGLRRETFNALLRYTRALKSYLTLNRSELEKLALQRDQIALEVLKPEGRAHAYLLSCVPEHLLEKIAEGRSVSRNFKQLDTDSRNAVLSYLTPMEDANHKSYQEAFNKGETKLPYQPTYLPADAFRLKYLSHGSGSNIQLRLLFDNAKIFFSSAFPGTKDNYQNNWLAMKRQKGRAGVKASLLAENRKFPEEIDFDTKKYYDYLKRVATVGKINVFSDAYPFEPNMETYINKAKKAVDVKVRKGANYMEALQFVGQWGRACWQEGVNGSDYLALRNHWYEFRDKGEWAALVKQTIQRKKENKPYDFEINLAINLLTNAKYLAINNTLETEDDFLRDARDPFRLYASLRRSEQEQLLRSGIRYGALSRNQQGYFEDLINAVNADIHPNAYGNFKVVMVITKDNGARLDLVVNDNTANPLKSWFLGGRPSWYLAKNKGGNQ